MTTTADEAKNYRALKEQAKQINAPPSKPPSGGIFVSINRVTP